MEHKCMYVLHVWYFFSPNTLDLSVPTPDTEIEGAP